MRLSNIMIMRATQQPVQHSVLNGTCHNSSASMRLTFMPVHAHLQVQERLLLALRERMWCHESEGVCATTWLAYPHQLASVWMLLMRP